MKTKTLKMAFAGIAIAILSFTVFFASADTHAQDENSSNIEASIDMDVDDLTMDSECQSTCTDKADCNKAADCSNCDISNCDEACMVSCKEMIEKKCQGNTTCGSGCKQ